MTDQLSETALTFAREILGWKDAKIDAAGFGDGTLISTSTPKKYFRADQESDVIKAVRAWVDTMEAWVLQITSDEDGWYVHVWGPDDDGIARGSDLCKCLMAACLQAKAKIDGVKDELEKV